LAEQHNNAARAKGSKQTILPADYIRGH
jgi:hypothetical protein